MRHDPFQTKSSVLLVPMRRVREDGDKGEGQKRTQKYPRGQQ